MKKVLIALILLFTLIVKIPLVFAEEIDFKTLATNYKEKNLMGKLKDKQELKDKATIEVTDTAITINYQDEASSIELETKFEYAENVISYIYTKDQTDAKTKEMAEIDKIWIEELFYILGELKGYNASSVASWLNKYYTLEELDDYGVSKTTFTYNNEQYTHTLFIDVENFNIDTIVEEEIEEENKTPTTPENNPNETNKENAEKNDVENPQTGLEDSLIYGIIGGIVLIVIYHLTNKSVIKRI